MHKTSRNDPCPCGSGRKYKNCCDGVTKTRSESRLWAWTLGLGVVACLGAAGFVGGLVLSDRSAGPGRVWSAEHGHWHDDNASKAGAPQPPGDPPAGKEWSLEHGHWHDATVPSPVDSIPASSP